MRQKFLILFSIIIFSAMNFAIYEKEQLKANGETILLELVHVDGPFLRQRAYMPLRYSLKINSLLKKQSLKNSIYVVVKADENQVAKLIRLHKGEELNLDEKLLRVKKKGMWYRIQPESFFFQEGQRKHYRNAKYAVFKFSSKDSKHEHMLIGLADEDRQLIIVD